MDLVTGAMGILAPKLLELLRHEYNLQTGVRKEARTLAQELEYIDAFLRKVADVPWDRLDEQVKVWAREVREASYDMEDALDIFLMHVEIHEPDDDQSMLRRALKMIGSLFIKGKPRHDIAVVIQGIKKQLQEVAERRARYKIDDSLVKPVAATSSTMDPRLAAMYHQVSQLIGIDKSRDQVISMLSYQHGSTVKIKTVSVVGVGGLGKTTLAKAVYEELKEGFDCGAFVPVGQKPDLKRIFKDILLDLDKGYYTRNNLNMDELDERRLIEEIREFLKEKRYFIVIDDIWEKPSWEIIKLVLVENNCGSRIITTTRNSEVAKETGEVYKLQPLSYYHSRKLFYTRIFGGEGKCPGVHSDEVSDKILKKCDGIPLAIITMASLLTGKSREVWSEIYNDIGFGQHKDNMHVENTMRILSFSYYDLPSHLRTCLLYLSAFPEDYVVEKDPLIWKWIAEGFVYKKQGNGLYELGERYFNDLINRSMIQAVEYEHDGIVEGCRVHDMVLDLIRSLSCHENCVTILDNNAEGLLSQNKWVPLLSFKLLRVLAIEDCQFKEGCHIENLGNLLHLRYLSLRNTTVSELPKQIGNLKFLQTLDLGRGQIKELPSSIVRLTQLVCLSCDGWGCLQRVPDGIGKLTSLEQLTIFFGNGYDDDEYKNNVRMFVKELGNLRELRVLHISLFFVDESVRRFLVESLRNLHKIHHIKLESSEFYVDVERAMWKAAGVMLPQHLCHLSFERLFQFPRLPSWIINRLHHLSYLSLRVNTIDELDLKLLGSLTELRYLKLDQTKGTATVDKINAGDVFFQKLRWFVMRHVMVQFQHEEDLTFSFHMWNGIDPMPFGSRRNNSCSLPSAVMPNLQVLETAVFVRALKDGNGDCSIIGLEYLTCLRKVSSIIHCRGASAIQVEETEAELQCAINDHPNRPTFTGYRRSEGEMALSVQDEESKDNSLPTEVEQEGHGKDKEYEEDHDKDENKDDEEEGEGEDQKGTSMRKRRRTED
ncbi:Disease resistance RPP13-like protein 4 [Dichanthelium oligosanthes]|uniref:Disease resistance RPP13-like protein 4 n=1 Tax=Dichanthelium oligosanthes TaxID=888268 RepID=A0A1E5UZG6_9POAL|nr:Disease resistance RPP13-like protein 4 [Dichanthelium oligosanthes]